MEGEYGDEGEPRASGAEIVIEGEMDQDEMDDPYGEEMDLEDGIPINSSAADLN